MAENVDAIGSGFTGFKAEDNLQIKRVLISVFNKDGLVQFAKKLREHGAEIITTGGTYKTLTENGVPATLLETITAFPEMLEGRVKTLQPEVFAGILARKPIEDHMHQLLEKKIKPIDMVVCNFYDFKEVALRGGATTQELIEKIDIGGPSLVRAAAKNYESVCVVPSKDHYDTIAQELDMLKGKISPNTRLQQSLATFRIVHKYDSTIVSVLDNRFKKPTPTKSRS